MIKLSKTLQEQRDTYLALSKLNSFLYSNPECEKASNLDRMKFINTMNSIATKMRQELHDTYHNVKCIVNGVDGVIDSPLAKTYGKNGETTIYDAYFIQNELSLWVNVQIEWHRDNHAYLITDITIK
jgi:hypothetical protein